MKLISIPLYLLSARLMYTIHDQITELSQSAIGCYAIVAVVVFCIGMMVGSKEFNN